MGQNVSASASTTHGDVATKPPDDPPPERLSKYDQQLISEGRVFTRYFIKKGFPGRVESLVSYHKPTKSIQWSSPDSVQYDPLHSMKVNDISKILYGKHTPAFQTSLAIDAPAPLCFSIVSDKLHRSIDLEASEETTAADFVRAMDHIMEQSKPVCSRWSLPAPPYQMPITQTSLSRALNASLIQYKPNKGIPKRVRKSKSRKLSGKKALEEKSTGKGKSNPLSGKPKVGSKRKTKSSPVIGSATPPRVVLAEGRDSPTEFSIKT